ncbi:MAG TPA: aminoglycoside 6-adenylyltransferase [Actinomycetota bacterium]|nr:aminoglycoside 6-adenylyltransferase [Actinomycetota bacterium]
MDQRRVLDDVLDWAADDENVRLVVLTGSFAREDHDELSDLDVELYVRDPTLLLEHTAWYERFGEVLVTEALENPDWHPTRLVYYVDAKIDFMIAPMSVLSEGVAYDGPFLVALDKDGRRGRLEPTVGVAPPSAEAFQICVHWFYAAALQYAKATVRDDPWPIKTRDVELKEQLLQMIEWDHGVRTGWAGRPPHNGSRITAWASPDVADALASCWADFSVGDSVDALRHSIALFNEVAQRVATALAFGDEARTRAAAEVDRIVSLRVGD